MSWPCGIGSNDLEKCGAGKKCDNGTCVNPCETAAYRAQYGLAGNGTWYQNDPDKPEYETCLRGVGGQGNSNTQGNQNSTSNSTNARQADTTNRFCLCAIDVGCGPAPPEPAVGLVFNIMWQTGNFNRNYFRTRGDFGPEARCRAGNYSCDRPRVTLAAMWLKRDDNNKICVEGPCCKNGGDKNGAINPRTSGGQPECPSGDAVQQCGNLGTVNGVRATYGPNAKGCEVLEFYCENVRSCFSDGSYGADYSAGIKKLFDIDEKEFGGFSAWKATFDSPPKGETYDMNIYGHTGELGSCPGRLWVHEMTKDKTASMKTGSFSNPGGGKQRQTNSYSWSYSDPPRSPWESPFEAYHHCATIANGGPDTKTFPGQPALLATITVLPDATWTIT